MLEHRQNVARVARAQVLELEGRDAPAGHVEAPVEAEHQLL
ncbi:MAG TPA: hypothetical protein VFH60_09355 [Chloroflexia bacterium]|nr:hypothetical protein [Chloroflexia bacterium]